MNFIKGTKFSDFKGNTFVVAERWTKGSVVIITFANTKTGEFWNITHEKLKEKWAERKIK